MEDGGMKYLKNWRSIGLTCLVLLTVSLYPCLFQYSTNLPESRFGDAMLFFGIFLGIGLLLFLVLGLILRRIEAAGCLAGIFLLVVINYGLLIRSIQSWAPGFRGLYLLAILGVLLGGLTLLVWRKKHACHVPLILLGLMFSALCLVMGFVAIPELLKTGPNESQAVLPEPVVATEDLPNVYYYLYDEYCGPESLRYYYDYDNSGFYEALEDRGFTCSSSSYNRESLATVQLVPDLYDLGYDVTPYFYSEDGKTPRLYQVFSQMGYRINLISHNDFLDTDGATPLTTNQAAESICTYLYENSILPNTPLAAQLEQLPQFRASYQYELLLQEALDTMETAWQNAQDGATLTLGYVQCPHSWFVYDADGDPVPEEDHLNWEDPQYYLGQLEYTNQRILKAVDQIQKNDPTAIIILQSDHGARLSSHLTELYDAPYDEATDTLPQQNILNCVYVPGKNLEIEGLSGINTLRTVLNQVYNMDYEMLPDPEMHYED
jgi:hypothetical protein